MNIWIILTSISRWLIVAALLLGALLDEMSGALLYEMSGRGEVWPWVTASEYPSWTLGHIIPHLHLVISRWLACVALSVPKPSLGSALAPKRELHKLLYWPQWFKVHKLWVDLSSSKKQTFHHSECQTCWHARAHTHAHTPHHTPIQVLTAQRHT